MGKEATNGANELSRVRGAGAGGTLGRSTALNLQVILQLSNLTPPILA
jgi:hypothetical protein